MSSVIILNTRHGLGSSNFDTYWDFDHLPLNDTTGFILRPLYFSTHNQVYPVNGYYNKVYFSENGGGILTATLTTQNYDGSELATEIALQMSAVGTLAYTGSFDLQTHLITISGPGAGNTFEFVAVASGNDVYNIMGFDTALFAAAETLTGNYPVMLAGTQNVDIVLNISTENYVAGITNNIFASVPVVAEFGGPIAYQFGDNLGITVMDDRLDLVTMRLFDEAGNPWELPDNTFAILALSVEKIQY